MTDKEREIIYILAQKMTGAHPDGTFQHGIFLTNVEKRMREKKIEDVVSYLQYAKENPEENLDGIDIFGHLFHPQSLSM